MYHSFRTFGAPLAVLPCCSLFVGHIWAATVVASRSANATPIEIRFNIDLPPDPTGLRRYEVVRTLIIHNRASEGGPLMRRASKVVLLVVVVFLVLIAVAVPFTIGLRPIIGAKSRPLTDRRFESTPARLERGKYLVTAVSGCIYCHGELDWNAPGFPIKPGTEG